MINKAKDRNKWRYMTANVYRQGTWWWRWYIIFNSTHPWRCRPYLGRNEPNYIFRVSTAQARSSESTQQREARLETTRVISHNAQARLSLPSNGTQVLKLTGNVLLNPDEHHILILIVVLSVTMLTMTTVFIPVCWLDTRINCACIAKPSYLRMRHQDPSILIILHYTIDTFL